MSGLVNPFSQIGDYRGNNANLREELVTTSYLTGLPDPRQISSESVSLIFRQLLKRDVRTKQRALLEFQQWLNGVNSSEQIEDSIHLSYIQMYSKLCIDISPQVRSQSHTTLGSLYSILGKKSSKYLKYSVGPWLAGQYDPDTPVANAARDSLRKIFPGDKAGLLVTKFEDAIREFIYDSCCLASAQTLSDERYFTKEEASQKYTRLVKCCLDSLIEHSHLFDLEKWEIGQLVETGRLWKFFSSSDAGLARSALRLAQAQLNNLDDQISNVWKELLRAGRKNVGGPGVALEVMQLMNVLTKRFPTETWPPDTAVRKDALASIGQFLVVDPPQPVKFWPLLYNLVLMVPEPPKRDLTPLFKPLEKTVLKVKHNRELEESLWGCFVSLSHKMGPSFIERAYCTAEERCKGSNVPLDSIAKFLGRYADSEGIADLVKSQLKNGPSKVPLEYVVILTKLHKFSKPIEEFIVPALGVKDLLLLVEADNDLKIPADMEITTESEWLELAAISHNVDAQHVVERLANAGMQNDILAHSRSLTKAGVKYCLDSYVTENINDIQVLQAAVVAHGGLVTDHVSSVALKQLIDIALQNQDEAPAILRVIQSNMEFVRSSSTHDDALAESLELLSLDDRKGVLRGLKEGSESSTNIERAAETRQRGSAFLKSLDLESLDLSVPIEATVNPLRAVVPHTSRSVDEGISSCEQIVSEVDAALQEIANGDEELDEDVATKLSILAEFVKSWSLVSPVNKFSAFVQRLSYMALTVSIPDLWNLVTSSNYGIAYHAAMAMTYIDRAEIRENDAFAFSREYFTAPSLRGALLAYFGVVEGNMQYDNIQRSLVREASTASLKTKEWMLVDRRHIPESASVAIQEPGDEDEVVSSVFSILTFKDHIQDHESLVYGSSNRLIEYAALSALQGARDNLHELLEFATSLPQDIGMDAISASHCLQLVNNYLETHNDYALEDPDVVQGLLERNDSLTLCWIGFQVLRHSQDKVPQLELFLEGSLSTQPSTLISWLIALNILKMPEFSEKALRSVLDFLTAEIKKSDVTDRTTGSENIRLPDTPPATLSSTVLLNILYCLCDLQPNTVREWYRDLRDKMFIRRLDEILASAIVPRLLGSIQASLNSESFGDEVEVSINEKQREIRASRSIEDEFTVEVIISLPEQYPGKPAIVNIRNLAGVSEGKKRGWLLEARQKLQSGGILLALKGILTRLNNFLDGIEPCAICYMTVNDLNKLPNKECSQCHNVYHSDCLYKWFSTNGNKLCPMCRSPI